MKTLNRKLHSQHGASILLALLFLLVCMMAAASVLTAAVSNAGKIRSNYEEQQRYLALSSALRLVAGELEQAEYRGRYTVTQWTEILTETENRTSISIQTEMESLMKTSRKSLNGSLKRMLMVNFHTILWISVNRMIHKITNLATVEMIHR